MNQKIEKKITRSVHWLDSKNVKIKNDLNYFGPNSNVKIVAKSWRKNEGKSKKWNEKSKKIGYYELTCVDQGTKSFI